MEVEEKKKEAWSSCCLYQAQNIKFKLTDIPQFLKHCVFSYFVAIIEVIFMIMSELMISHGIIKEIW